MKEVENSGKGLFHPFDRKGLAVGTVECAGSVLFVVKNKPFGAAFVG